MKVLNFIKFWFENARYHSLVQSFWPAAAALCIASSYSGFNIKYDVIAVIGVLLAHLSVNLFDDYFDFKLGSVEKRNQLEGVIRSGKCKYILDGGASLSQLFAAAAVFGILALLAGFYLFLHRGMPVLIIAGLAGLLGFFYSAPPLKLSYNALGEIVVGLMFGPLLMNGVFYCAAGTVSLQVLLLSFALGSLIVNILYVHSIMDMKADTASGKRTLATILPNKFFRLTALVFFAIYPYWIVLTGVLRYGMPKCALAVFLTVPLTVVSIKYMIEYENGVKKDHEPKFWMGQMECWDKMKALGIDWFMIRWLLARNITGFFSLILCAAYIFRVLF